MNMITRRLKAVLSKKIYIKNKLIWKTKTIIHHFELENKLIKIQNTYVFLLLFLLVQFYMHTIIAIFIVCIIERI